MVFQNIYSALNLLGVTSLLGGEISKNSLKYININSENNKKLRMFTSFLVIPGLYNVSNQMLKRNNTTIARIFSPGERENKKAILGLKCNNKYRYIGMKSGTNANVSNVLFESWISKNKKKSQSSKNFNKNILFKDNISRNKKSIIIKTLKIDKEWNLNRYDQIFSPDGKLFTKKNIFCIFLQFISMTILFLLFILHDYFSIFIIICNMLCYSSIVYILSKETYKIPNFNPYNKIEGNSLVIDQSGNELFIILGTEEKIQNLLQHEIIRNSNEKENIEVVISTISCIISIISILFMSLMTDIGKLLYGIELCIGLTYNIIYSYRDGNKILKKITEYFYDIEEEDVDSIEFTNRASGMAYIVLKTKGYSKQLGKLIPKINEWYFYRKLLDEINENNSKLTNLLEYVKNNNNGDIDNLVDKFLKIQTINELVKTDLGKRLINDILEAYIEI